MENETETQPETTTSVVITEKVDTALELFNAFYVNAQKFYIKGTTAAIARARKSASELMRHLKVVRKELQEAKVAKIAARKNSKTVEPAA